MIKTENLNKNFGDKAVLKDLTIEEAAYLAALLLMPLMCILLLGTNFIEPTGLLAMGEIPLYWWDGLAEGETACAAKLDAAKRQLQAMIRRDANHPALIFYEVR